MIFFRQGLKIHPADAVGADGVPPAGHHRPVQNGQVLVRDNQRRVRLQLHPQTHAGRAGAKGAVKGEHPGRQLLNGDAAVVAGVVLGELQIPLLPQEVHRHQSSALPRRRLHGVRQPLADVGPDNEPVHHDLHRVLFVLLQGDFFRQLIEVSVRPHPGKACPACVLQHLGVLPLAPPHHRRQHLDAGSLGQGQNLVNDLIHRLLPDLLAALRAVGRAHPGPQQPEIVVNLRHRTHGGPGVFAGGLLVNGNRRGKPVDVVHIGLIHLSQKHPGIAGQALHIPPLSLGINGVKGQGGLAAAGKPRHHHQLVPGNGHINILEIILPCALNKNMILHGFSFALKKI